MFECLKEIGQSKIKSSPKMSVNIDTILDTAYDVHVDVTLFDPANTQCNNFLFWRTYQWLK